MSLQETLKALSDPTRREILQMLRSGSKSAGEISKKFDITALKTLVSINKNAMGDP